MLVYSVRKHFSVFLVAMFFGVTFGVFAHGYWLIDIFPLDSRRLFFSTILAGLLGFAVYFFLIPGGKKRFQKVPICQRWGLLGASALIGSFLLFAGTENWLSSVRYFTILLPTHTLQISAPNASSSPAISVVWLTTSLGDVSLDSLQRYGWERKGEQLVAVNPVDNKLVWVGKAGDMIQVVFQSSIAGNVTVSYNGEEETLELPSGNYVYRRMVGVPFYASRILIFFFGILHFSAISLIFLLLIWERREEWTNSILYSMGKIERPGRTEVLFLICAAFLALLLRVFNLENLYPAIDEYYHLIAARQIVEGASFYEVYQRSLWPVTLLVSLAFRVFGYHLWAARLAGSVFNVLALLPLYLLARKINRPVAMISALLYATSPWVITFARVVREYAYYPFYFSLVVLGMVLFLQKFPSSFVWYRDWKKVNKAEIGWLGFVLLLPLVYAIYDASSTFKLILIAYVVFGVFLLRKIDLRAKANLLVLLLVGGMLIFFGYTWAEKQIWTDFQLVFNPGPMGYFFPNPPQQWYFARLGLIVALGFILAVFWGVYVRGKNIVPLFLIALFMGYLVFFALADHPTRPLFRTRYLVIAEIWFLLIVAFGLYLLWHFLQLLFAFKNTFPKICLTLMLGALIFNTGQSLLPTLSSEPDMPISRDYHYNLGAVHEYMITHAQNEDVLISTAYRYYASWMNEPRFQAMYGVSGTSPEEELLSVVEKYNAGWIVIDEIVLKKLSFNPRLVFSRSDKIEYIGLFGDQHVWHWSK